MKYDTILFGNGLTLAILNEIKNFPLIKNSQEYSLLCNQNNFIENILSTDPSIGEHRKFRDFFLAKFPENKDVYSNQVNLIQKKIDLQCFSTKGFEYYGGKNIFEKDLSVIAFLLYALNNWWFQCLKDKVIEKKFPIIKNVIKQYQNLLSKFDKCYTLNFDTLLDSSKRPIEHLHGRFVYPFNDPQELIFLSYSEKIFEYPFLFGTSSFEKLNRLNFIKKNMGINSEYYNLDFFYNENLELGNLLIFGISFMESGILSDDNFLNQYPQHRDENNPLSRVDWHVLQKISQMQKENRVDNITIACYDEKDYSYYERITKMHDITAEIKVDTKLKNFLL